MPPDLLGSARRPKILWTVSQNSRIVSRVFWWAGLELDGNVGLGKAEGGGVALLELESESDEAGVLTCPRPVINFGQAGEDTETTEVPLRDFDPVVVAVVLVLDAQFRGQIQNIITIIMRL